ncbi:MAG: nucleoside-diphosphate kinase [Bacteroidales bacterium]|nr:nucleoside-diphosphate kinase [Bacteroidales bacterium]
MERTLVILKPATVQRALCGEVISRFEKKGLKIVAMKMVNLTDELLFEHYGHLKDKPFFPILLRSMKKTPVVLMALEGVEAVRVVREMGGVTNGRNAALGTIRGDYCMSKTENIVHTSDSPESAAIELARFFKEEEYCTYANYQVDAFYAEDEL